MKYLVKLLVTLALAMTGLQVQALSITPNDCDDGTDATGTITCWIGDETTANQINNAVSLMLPVTELYRAEVGSEDKLLADSYATTFDSVNPSASITYGSGQYINCPTCYLLVKDSDASPAWRLFDISDLWDGMEAINLGGFDVAITQVSIYGGPPGTSVAAPGPLGLLSIGLLLSGLRRLKQS